MSFPPYDQQNQPGQQPSYGQQPYSQPPQGQVPYGQPQPSSFGQPQPSSFGQPQPSSFGQPQPGLAQPGLQPGYGGYGGPGGTGPKKSAVPIVVGAVVGLAVLVGIFFAIQALTTGGSPGGAGGSGEQSDDGSMPTDDPSDLSEGVTEIADVDLTPGDCLVSLEYNEHMLLDQVDCATPHGAEVVAERIAPYDDFPGDQVVSDEAGAFCDGEIPDLVRDLDTTNVEYSSLYPTQGTWSHGDRKYTCVLTTFNGAQLTGSVVAGDATVS